MPSGDSQGSLPQTIPGSAERPELRSVGAQIARGAIAGRLFGRETEPVRVGRFTVIERVGAGAMGSVYAAYDPELDRRVALKVLRGASTETTRREAQALARLTHPNVVAVYELGEHEGRGFLVMEFVRGASLDQWLLDAQPSAEAILAAFADAGRGLAAAHDAGLVHRDFKPANVMRGDDGRVRVTDFGLARRADDDDVRGGTPAYMAPEQARDGVVDPRADQYSFCRSLAEALGGLPDGPLPETLPPAMRRALERGLREAPAERWPDMRSLLAALEPPARRPRVGMAIAGGGALVLALGAWSSRTTRTKAAAPCAEAAAGFETVWSAERERALARAFELSGSPLASNAIERVGARLDALALRWGEARQRACRDTKIDGVWSDEALDLRYACLDELRARTDALLGAFEPATPEVVRRATRAVASTGRPEDCDDVERLRTRTPPVPESAREAVASARAAVNASRAQVSVGDFATARETIGGAMTGLPEGVHDPSLSALLIVDAVARQSLGEREEAVDQLRRAYWLATSSRADEPAARAAVAQVFALTKVAAPLPVVDEWGGHARAALARLGGDRDQEGRLANHLGVAASVAGDRTAAIAHYERAIELWLGLEPPHTVEAALARVNLGAELELLGRHDESRVALEAGIGALTEELGADHPSTASATLAQVNLELSSGRPEQALPLAEQALATRTATSGRDTPALANAHSTVCRVHNALRDFDAAGRECARAVALLEAEFGKDSGHLAYPLTSLANTQLERHEFDEAEALYRRALALDIARYGDGSDTLGYSYTGIAHAQLGAGLIADAIATYERALEHYGRGQIDPLDVGEAKFGLARALRRAGSGTTPPRAIQLARDALTAYEAAGRDEAETVRAWLDDPPTR